MSDSFSKHGDQKDHKGGTMRPPPLPPRPSPRGVQAAPQDAHDRPTPRSTVIPRLPPLAPAARQPMPTLIFHGAPPIPKAPITRPEGVDDHVAFDLMAVRDSSMDVRSDDLIEIGTRPNVSIDMRETPHVEVIPSSRSERPIAEPIASFAWKPAAALAACTLAVAWLALTRAPSEHGTATTAHAGTSAPAAAPAAPPKHPGLCALAGTPRLLSRRALVRGGVEATTFDGRLAFGVLSGNKEGIAFEVDPASFAVASSARVMSPDLVRRVVPALAPDAPLGAEVDPGTLRIVADADGDALIGTHGGYVVWGTRDTDTTTKLWKLDGPQDIEAARVVTLGASGERAVAFRRGGAIWVGAFRLGEVSPPLGPMVRISDGMQVGAPSIDARGDEMIVAWAQRQTKTSGWEIHWTRWRSGAEAEKSHALTLAPGGPGERALAPSVAVLAGGRFLLAWTEGASTRHQVRAQVIDELDHPTGEALAISPPDVVAGQEQIAIARRTAKNDFAGAVAYLSSKGRSFELMATPIACDPL